MSTSGRLTFAAAVHIDACEPVISDKIALYFAIWDVSPRCRVYVLLGETEVYHVYRVLIWFEANDTVTQLYISM